MSGPDVQHINYSISQAKVYNNSTKQTSIKL